jgi:hypothetical protein
VAKQQSQTSEGNPIYLLGRVRAGEPSDERAVGRQRGDHQQGRELLESKFLRLLHQASLNSTRLRTVKQPFVHYDHTLVFGVCTWWRNLPGRVTSLSA